MKLKNDVVAYELAHSKYMASVAQPEKQDGWGSAYETIRMILALHNINCKVLVNIDVENYNITVYIENDIYEFVFSD